MANVKPIENPTQKFTPATLEAEIVAGKHHKPLPATKMP